MIRSIGLDVHRLEVQACIMDGAGKVLCQTRFPATRESIAAFVSAHLRSSDQVVLEATFHTWAIADLIAPHVHRLVVSNPMQTKAIAQAKIKTDKVDAKVLANLLRCDYLPEVWQPDFATRALRTLAGRRAGLVRNRICIKNRIHGVLAKALIQVKVDDVFSEKGMRWLSELQMDAMDRALIDSDLRMLALVEAELDQVEDEIARRAYQSPYIKLLMTLPGVDFATAAALIAALGDFTRFRDGDHAASYLGLVPSTYQSGTHCYHGHITKRGNTKARWMLIQGAQHLGRNPGPLGVFFRRIAKRKNHNVAVVAAARKLVVIAWHMLTTGEPYRYAQPAPTQNKLVRLRVRVTGVRSKTGPKKGQAVSPTYGSGQRFRRFPSLNELLEAEHLPNAKSFDQIPEGEKTALRKMGAATYAAQIGEPQYIARHKKHTTDTED